MVNPYGGWGMSSKGEYKINNERYNKMGEGYGTRYSINDPKIFTSFESKLQKLRKSDSLEELKTNYRDLARKYHPDKGGSHRDFIHIKNEYDSLISSF